MDSDDEFIYSDEDSDIEMDTDGKSHNTPSVKHTEVQKLEYRVLNSNDLEERRSTLIKDVSELLSVSVDVATLLLMFNNWSKEKLLESYYSDPEKACKKAGATFDLDFMAKSTLNSNAVVVCPVLFVECPINDTLALGCCSKDYPDPEDHRFSNISWKGYLKSRANEGSNCLTTTCQRDGCGAIVPPSIWELLLQDNDVDALDRYNNFMTNNFVELNKYIKWCPTPGCGAAVEIPQKSIVSIVDCSNCSNKFCFKCNKDDHSPVSCKLLEIWEEKCQNESETANWILANTKSCPKCKVRIEKNQGCNHMQCQKCNHHFCWICLNPWEDHNTNTGGYYNCNRYNSASKEDEDERGRAKRELDRYLHYYKRFASHNDSLKFARRQLTRAKRRMEEIQETEGKGWVEVQFLGDAVKQVIDCRKMLKHSYILAYYLPQDNEKMLFEDNQSRLEQFTEALSEKTEMAIEDLDKAAVNNLSSVAKQFLEKINEAADKDHLNESALTNLLRTE